MVAADLIPSTFTQLRINQQTDGLITNHLFPVTQKYLATSNFQLLLKTCIKIIKTCRGD